MSSIYYTHFSNKSSTVRPVDVYVDHITRLTRRKFSRETLEARWRKVKSNDYETAKKYIDKAWTLTLQERKRKEDYRLMKEAFDREEVERKRIRDEKNRMEDERIAKEIDAAIREHYQSTRNLNSFVRDEYL